jgi:aspartate aminotransferase
MTELARAGGPVLAAENPIFAIGDRAAALRAAGVDVITLAAGEPEQPTADSVVVEAAAAALRDPRTHHYGSAGGLAELREEIAGRHATGPVDAARVQVAVGTKHAVHLALAAVAGPGDVVLVAQPSWPGHVAGIASVGARATPVPAGPDGLIEVEGLERACTPEVRAVVLANPSNPSGAVHPPERVRAIARWCLDRDVWFISDEVYGGLVYDGIAVSALETVPDVSRLIVVDGVSKVHAMTGWRVGWLIGPDAIVATARKQVSATITHVPLVTQHAALAALRDPITARDAAEQYRQARDLLVDGLQSVPGVSCPRPAGGMFAFPDVSELLGNGRWRGTAELAGWLLEEAHVAVVPGGVFGAENHLRISFAVGRDRLAEATSRLVRALVGADTIEP